MKKLIFIFSILSFAFTKAQTPNFQWARAMGGISQDLVNSITVDPSGNVFTTGYLQGIADFDPGPAIYNLPFGGSADFFISKLDASGNFVWAKSIGNAGTEGSTWIASDASGNIYITGEFTGTVDFDPGPGISNLTSSAIPSTQFNTFILKLDGNGNFIWVKQIEGDTYTTGYDGYLDAAGNIYVIGGFMGTVDLDPGVSTSTSSAISSRDIYITKLDNSGNFLWGKVFGGTGLDIGGDIRTDAANNVYCTGYFNGIMNFDPAATNYTAAATGTSDDPFVMKLDAAGNYLWHAVFSGTGNDYGNCIAVDAFGNVYTGGAFRNSVDFDPGPGTYSLSSSGLEDIYISKLDVNGNFVSAYKIGNTLGDAAYSMEIDASGDLYTTGYFSGSSDFNIGPGAYFMTSSGNTDAFTLKLNSAGNFVWANQVKGNGQDAVTCMALDASNNIYTAGYFNSTSADFDPTTATYTLNSSNYDVFVLKLGQSPSGINENTIDVFTKVYPNPNNGLFNVNLNEVTKIVITDVLGKEIFNQILKGGKQQLNIQDQSAGIYSVKLIMENKQEVIKLIKE